MRTARSIRNRGARLKKGPVDIDITSLLDVLVIMLVFLLKSYSSGIIINIPRNIELPSSESTSVNSVGINIQLSKDVIYVDDKIVYQENTSGKKLSNMVLIYPLYDELVRKKETIRQIQKTTPDAKKFSGVANLILDRSIRYKTMQKIMHTCATAGFKTYKFVVLGEDN